MICRIGLRIATVEALRGKTLVGNNVLDSHIGALDVGADGSIRTDQEKPFIAVYVDDSKAEDSLTVRGLHEVGTTDLTIEIGISTVMTETDQETGESTVVGIGIPATDRAFEFFLDVVGRQVTTALSDPKSEWAEIWKSLSRKVIKVERKRASDTVSGTRIAAHQLVITLDLLSDPVFGEPLAPTSSVARLFAKMQVEEHPFLPQLLDLVGSPGGDLDHEAQRRRRGMTLDEARALCDMPPPGLEAIEPAIQTIEIVHAGS